MVTGRKVKIRRDRLSVVTRQGIRKSELVSKVREEESKNFSRLEIGHKSNRMVLNEAAARLGQSINTLVDFKFPLIDLETYGVSYGDRAQATERWAA